jgi:hypothetical protein
MSLSFTGDALKTIHTANYRAIGSHGELIIAEASHEAVQDCGEAAVQQKRAASTMRRKFSITSSPLKRQTSAE